MRRYINVGTNKRLWTGEIFRCHADHREVGTIHTNRASQNRTVAREGAIPKAIADDRHQIPARDGIFLSAECAPDHRLDAQAAKEIPADAGIEAVLRNLIHL